jgi:membrane protease subunit HflK
MANDPSHPDSNPGPADASPTPKPPEAPEPQRGVEDAGAQALSEALRSTSTIVKFLVAGLVAAFVFSGVFTVKPNQVAVKLRLGKPVGVGAEQLLKPGLHWKLPYPIDDVVLIPVGESHTVTSTAGWYAQTPEEAVNRRKPQPKGMLQAGVDGYTLTGDGNIIHAQATMSYRISDPISYWFNFANVTNLLQHILDNALFYAAARFKADDALYGNRLAFQETVQTRVREMVEKLNLGVTVQPGEVRTDTEPPVDVAEAFNDVTRAQNQGDIKIQEAETYARGATNRAVGEASVIVGGGMTASNSLIVTVAAEADRFAKLLPRYNANPDLFKRRLLAETMERVLTNAQYKLFLPESADGKPWEVRLQLSKPPEVPKKETPKPE